MSSQSRSTTDVRDALAPHAETFAEVAEETDDLAQADALTVLAALGRGEPVPEDVLQRIKEREGVATE